MKPPVVFSAETGEYRRFPYSKPPGRWRMLGRGFRRRCPWCGGGNVFSSWFTMRPACPTCGHRFERAGEEAFFLGAMVINFAATEGVLGVMLLASFVLTLPDPPLLLLCGVAVPLMIVSPIAFYPFSRTIWAAFDIMMRPPEQG